MRFRSYCEYRSLDRTFNGNRRVSASVATVDLGFSANDAKNLTVEQRVACALLAGLPGG